MEHCRHHRKKLLLRKLMRLKGIWFHLVGLVCVFWVLIRVGPAPHRAQYPCQQIALPLAAAYAAFWTALFFGLIRWIRHVKTKSAKTIPSVLVVCALCFTFGGMVFAGQTNTLSISSIDSWSPVPNQPFGAPQGLNPGRVVWVWDLNATVEQPQGYWWLDTNNDQDVIDAMIGTGLRSLTDATTDTDAWNALFISFNQEHGYGTTGYQPGEKIAIKINLNNCWEYRKNEYTERDNERDASPHVVKALLRQLIDVVGVRQEDITVFDASRSMANWFYNRVYYTSYPAVPLDPEFPDVHFVDAEGGATGREQVVASTVKIYFANETELIRTLPTCIVDAKYLINMPILKRHPINQGVTLSGKNLYGTFMEPVVDVHTYHIAGHTMGNPTPQAELLAHTELGGKTLLYLGDGLYGTKEDHRTIAKFQMYPFNGDWTNSLFFSQDPVAIDSVMYDFLKAEGTNPCEGSQNYLHQAAAPPPDVYDPEHDGTFVSSSLGVHEHWNTSADIFSSDRYLGVSGNGIDFIARGSQYASPAVVITQPQEKYVYVSGVMKRSFPCTLLLRNFTVEARVNHLSDPVQKIEFYVDNHLEYTDTEAPYQWSWETRALLRHELTVTAYYDNTTLSDTMMVWKFF